MSSTLRFSLRTLIEVLCVVFVILAFTWVRKSEQFAIEKIERDYRDWMVPDSGSHEFSARLMHRHRQAWTWSVRVPVDKIIGVKFELESAGEIVDSALDHLVFRDFDGTTFRHSESRCCSLSICFATDLGKAQLSCRGKQIELDLSGNSIALLSSPNLQIREFPNGAVGEEYLELLHLENVSPEPSKLKITLMELDL